MIRMGRPPKPTALKILQGNPGKRPLNENEPVFQKSDNTLKPPAFLSSNAKKEWKRIAPMLTQNNLLTDADMATLAAYCQSYHRWVEAEKIINKYGMTCETTNGNIIQRPEVGIANKSMGEMIKCAKEFGLTPSSRANLKALDSIEQEDSLMQFVSGSKRQY